MDNDGEFVMRLFPASTLFIIFEWKKKQVVSISQFFFVLMVKFETRTLENNSMYILINLGDFSNPMKFQ